jgi:hypothetical protein
MPYFKDLTSLTDVWFCGGRDKFSLDMEGGICLQDWQMKKLFAVALLGVVSFVLVGSPVQACENSKPGTVLVKHKKKHRKHKEHKAT